MNNPVPGGGPAAAGPAQAAQPGGALSVAAQARALAASMRIDPELFAGREEGAVAVMLRLQRFVTLSDRDKQNFPGFVDAQGFPEGDRFRRAAVGITLDFRTNPDWAPPGVQRQPPDDKMGERLQRAIEVAIQEAPAEAKAGLLHLKEPGSIAALTGVVGVFVAVQFTPAGWVADALGGALLLGTALAVGLDVLTLLSDLDTFIEGVNSPRGDPEAAGRALAHAAGLLAVDALVGLLMAGVGGLARAAKRFVRARSGEVDVLTSRGGVVRMSAQDAAGIRKGDNLDSHGQGASEPGQAGTSQAQAAASGDKTASNSYSSRRSSISAPEEGPDGNPRMIFTGRADLAPRQQKLLEQLPEFGSRVEVARSEAEELDISALTAITGDEFAYFSRAGKVLLVRGNARTVPINEEVAAELAREGWRWNAHTQPGDTLAHCLSSEGDRAILRAMGQRESTIYNSVGDYETFTPDGRSLRDWRPR